MQSSKLVCLSVLLGTIALSGCDSPKEPNERNFANAISKTLNDRCVAVSSGVTEFPATVMDKNFGVKRLIALTNAGLLTSTPAEVKSLVGNKNLPGHTYTLTEKGKASIQPDSGTFCAGKFKVKEITSFTVPATGLGRIMSDANFTYDVVDIPDWAESKEIRETFRMIDNMINKKGEQKATLILNNDGWVASTLLGNSFFQ